MESYQLSKLNVHSIKSLSILRVTLACQPKNGYLVVRKAYLEGIFFVFYEIRDTLHERRAHVSAIFMQVYSTMTSTACAAITM